MSAIPMLTEEECYLAAILDDPSGVELAEFCWIDEEKDDGCFRLWDYQWVWYRNEATFQIDWCGRAVGKSVGIQMRAFAFPFNHPGAEMLITAPELNHLRPVTDKVEHLFRSTKLGSAMLPKTRGLGINHQPQFQVQFINNARIISRLPNRDGRGVKGSCAAGALVSTVRGLVPIEQVRIGDYVLTHAGRYARVEHVHSYEAETVLLAGHGHPGLRVSANHRVYGRRNANPQRRRSLGQPGWVDAANDELARWYWASPMQFPELELPDVPTGVEDGVALLELAGRWVADGNLGVRGDRVVHAAITVKDGEFDAVRRLFKAAGYSPSERPHDGTARCLVQHSTELAIWLREHFGHRAEGKRIPAWLLGAPAPAREAFLIGYLAGDGHWQPERARWTAGSASKALALGVKLLAQSLGQSTGFGWVDPKVTSVCGQPLVSQPRRSYRTTISQRGVGIAEHDHLWSKISSAKEAGMATVYDLVVAEDHSYVADGIVHLGSAWLPDGTVA